MSHWEISIWCCKEAAGAGRIILGIRSKGFGGLPSGFPQEPIPNFLKLFELLLNNLDLRQADDSG